MIDVGLQRPAGWGLPVGLGCWRRVEGGWCGRRPVNGAELCDECADELRQGAA